MKLAIVVQRYGADINGGAELHARHIAEHLAAFADICVLTTCARDYLTWRNDLPAGADAVHGVPVERFPVAHEREAADFSRLSDLTFLHRHSFQDELAWLDSEGPTSPALVERLSAAGAEFDFALFFSVRYYHAFHGVRAVPDRAILVPTAEREPSLGLGIFGPIFRSVRAIMYNSPEEQDLIQSIAGNHRVPGATVGVGVDLDRPADGARFRSRFGIDGPYVLYIGRIDENKGCGELFDHFRRYARSTPHPPRLLLVGTSVMEVPTHALIQHLGYVTEQDKFDALAGASALLMPSYYESLSMVVLEAWALGRPVLVNARCDVLMGHCLRSNGGLYYENVAEFCAALQVIMDDAPLADAMGRNGRTYCEREYAWPVVERKYRDLLSMLQRDTRSGQGMERLPGWWARRRRTLPPAAAVVARAQSGPVIDRQVRAS